MEATKKTDGILFKYVLGESLTAVLLYLGLEGTARNAGYTFRSCRGLLPPAETGQNKCFFYVVLAYFMPFLLLRSNVSKV